MASRKILVRAGLALSVLVVGLVLLNPWEHQDPRVDEAAAHPRGIRPATNASGTRQPILRGERSQVDLRREEPPTAGGSRTVAVRVVCEGIPDTEGMSKRAMTKRANVGLGPTGTRDRGREVWQWVDDGETALMEVPVTGAIRVRCGASPWAPDGTLPEVPVGQDEVTIRLVPACRIDVQVLDASSRLPVRGEMEILVERFATGECVLRGSSAEDLRRNQALPRLPTGEYRVSVTASGYEPWAAPKVRLDHPGARANLTVRLSPEATSGRLVLDLDPPVGGTLEGAWIHAEVMRRRRVGDETWTALPPRTLDQATHAATLTPLDPGDYRVLAWAGRDLVGLVDDVTIHANQVAHARLRLGRGLLVPLADLPWKPTFYTDSRLIEVSTRDGASLPVLYFASRLSPMRYGGWLMSKHEYRDERPGRAKVHPQLPRRSYVQHNDVLGPYPYETVIVREGHGRALQERAFTDE